MKARPSKAAARRRELDEPAMTNVIESEIEGTLNDLGCCDTEIHGMAFAIASGHEHAIDAAARIIAARLATNMRAMQVADANSLVGDDHGDYF